MFAFVMTEGHICQLILALPLYHLQGIQVNNKRQRHLPSCKFNHLPLKAARLSEQISSLFYWWTSLAPVVEGVRLLSHRALSAVSACISSGRLA